MPVYYTIFCGKRQEVFLMRGRRPLRTPFFSLPPRRGFAGAGAPAPTSGPTRPTPGVPFVSRRKEPKACRGCAPGPRCVVTALSALAPLCSGSRRAASCVFTGSHASAAAWGTHSPAALAAPLWDADSLRFPFHLSSKKTAVSPVGSAGRTWQCGPIRGQELFPDEGDGNREWEQGNKHLFLLYIHFYIYLL